MNGAKHIKIVDFIWGIADGVLEYEVTLVEPAESTSGEGVVW